MKCDGHFCDLLQCGERQSYIELDNIRAAGLQIVEFIERARPTGGDNFVTPLESREGQITAEASSVGAL